MTSVAAQVTNQRLAIEMSRSRLGMIIGTLGTMKRNELREALEEVRGYLDVEPASGHEPYVYGSGKSKGKKKRQKKVLQEVLGVTDGEIREWAGLNGYPLGKQTIPDYTRTAYLLHHAPTGEEEEEEESA